MITIRPSHEKIAMQVDFAYPQYLDEEEMQIASEIELVALFQALNERYGIEKSSEIITNAVEAYINAHAI